jgi:hypothetical protein
MQVLGKHSPAYDPQTEVPRADQVIVNQSDIGLIVLSADDRDRPEQGKSRPAASLTHQKLEASRRLRRKVLSRKSPLAEDERLSPNSQPVAVVDFRRFADSPKDSAAQVRDAKCISVREKSR